MQFPILLFGRMDAQIYLHQFKIYCVFTVL